MNSKIFIGSFVFLSIFGFATAHAQYGTSTPTSTPTSTAPFINALSPSKGRIGTNVLVHGSNFVKSSGISQKRNTVVVSNDIGYRKIPTRSANGKMLAFSFPSTLFAPSVTSSVVAVEPGLYRVFVNNAYGTSNTVNFLVTTSTATSTGVGSSGGGASNKPLGGSLLQSVQDELDAIAARLYEIADMFAR